MELRTTREHLLQAIQLTEKLTGKKESLPVLSCVLLEAKNKVLIVRATNLESGLEVRVPVTMERDGVIAVPASVLRETVRVLRSDIITLREQEGNLVVESKGSKNVIKAVSHEEFPSIPTEVGQETFSISRPQLQEILSSVMYAASPSMIRPELGSVCIVISNDSILSAATDSFRLAEKKVSYTTKNNKEFEILIPLKHAQELIYILEHLQGDTVTVDVEETQLCISNDFVRFVSRVVGGNFPNYKEIIPKDITTKAIVIKGDFVELLRKARVFSGPDQNIGLHIYPQKKIFSVTARSGDVGEMSDTIETSLQGEDLDINFHIGYLLDCMSSVRSDSVTLEFSGVGRPLVIRGVSDQTFMYLVMPLNR